MSNIEELEIQFAQKTEEYEAKYGERPHTCYCPAPLFEEFMVAIKEEMDNSRGFYLFDLYRAAKKHNSFCLFGVRVCKSIVEEIDFTVPLRENS